MDRCVICGRLVPEGRMVCWICEKVYNTPYTCIHFDGDNYICMISGKDCVGHCKCELKEE